jgi:Serine/threonine protein kinase
MKDDGRVHTQNFLPENEHPRNAILATKFQTNIPRLDSRFESDYNVLAVGTHYLVLSVINPPSRVPAHTSNRNNGTAPWNSPSRHYNAKGKFVMKIAYRSKCSLENEIKILTKIRDAQCLHLPELVWAPTANTELGIMPLGTPIRPPESAIISRKIIQGMIEGLRYLHGEHIIHRDIRLSNLILHDTQGDINVVIIDYETACDLEFKKVQYLGGYVCWPKRLLETRTQLYVPEPADDLYASILVVLHMLFPSRFDNFKVSGIGSNSDLTPETLEILQLWKDIEASTIWGRFYQAARDLNYDTLLEMGDCFCHV